MPEVGVTVVVPTLDRGRVLLDCIKDLAAQTHRPLEILVVDQSEQLSGDVAEFVRTRENLISYHRCALGGLPQARNYGWQRARYDALIFVDDDIRCAPDFVRQHLRALSLPDVGLVGGGINERHRDSDPGPPTGTFNRWTATPVRGFASHDEFEVDHAPGGNFSVWRTALQKCGGVDERLAIGAGLYEETDLCLRLKQAGYRVYFNGNAQLEHLAAASGGCRVKNPAAYIFGLAHNRALLIERHVRWFQIPIALARLAVLTASHALHYRSLRGLLEAIPACVQGWRNGAKRPACTDFAAKTS